jgi:predicted glycosyltransferase
MAYGRVFLYVQHLLGVGHLQRALRIAAELAHHGVPVTLVSGGMPIEPSIPEGIDWVQLPPLRAADARFSDLVDVNGHAVDEAWRTTRLRRLLRAFEDAEPQLLITETFPFGRRQMRFELLPLLRAAHRQSPRPMVVSSVRDVLQSGRKPGRVDEAAAWAERFYDRILVHGDPRAIRFEETFAPADRLARRIHYTGYVGAGVPPFSPVGNGEVIVSAGGGAVGARLLETALAARPLSRARSMPWRLLAGHSSNPDALRSLRRNAGVGVTVESSRADFPALLANARLSISQGGYNTLMDILQARARAVVVPFAGDGETEQTFRAARFAEMGFFSVLQEAALNAVALAHAVDAALMRPRPDTTRINLQGAADSAALLAGWVRGADAHV